VTTHFFKVASTLLSGTTATFAAAYGDALVLTPTTVSPASQPKGPSWRKAMRTFLNLPEMTLGATSQPAAFLSNHTSSGLRSKVLSIWKELVDLCHFQSPSMLSRGVHTLHFRFRHTVVVSGLADTHWAGSPPVGLCCCRLLSRPPTPPPPPPSPTGPSVSSPGVHIHVSASAYIHSADPTCLLLLATR
jgi:hypothetical protein